LDPALAIVERRISADEVRDELLRFERALRVAEEQLGHSLSGADEGELAAGHEEREIDRDLLTGASLAQACRNLIQREQISAETAVRGVLNVSAALEGTAASSLDAGADIEAVGDRLLRALLKLPEHGPALPPPAGAIAIARDFHEDEVMELKEAGVAAIATEHGSAASPVATAARAVGLPYVTGVEGVAHLASAGMTVAVDGDRGRVILDPDEPTFRAYRSGGSSSPA
jgi:phosphoenolpyruvate-protein kinase (PTS system EI component)